MSSGFRQSVQRLRTAPQDFGPIPVSRWLRTRFQRLQTGVQRLRTTIQVATDQCAGASDHGSGGSLEPLVAT